MAIATLTIDLVAKLANLQTGFDRAAQLAESRAKRIDSAFKTVGRTLAGLGVGLSIERLVSAFNTRLENVAQFKDLAEQTGIAVEELSKLEPTARGAGVAMSGVADLSQKLSRALSGVDTESRGAGKALAAIGINLGEFRSLGAAEQLQALARALDQYEDSGNKVAIAQAILGRTGAQYLSFLKDLAGTGQLVATLTAEQARAADEYGKTLKAAQLSLEQFGRTLALDILPSVTRVIDELRDGIEAFGGLSAAVRNIGTTNPFLTLGQQVEKYRDQVTQLRQSERDLLSQQGGPLAQYAERALAKIRDELNTSERLLRYFQTQQRRQALEGSGGILDALDARARSGTQKQLAPFVAVNEETKKSIDKAKEAADRFLESLREQAAAAGRTAEEVLRIRAAALGVAPAAEPFIRVLEDAKQRAQDLANTIDQLNEVQRERDRADEEARRRFFSEIDEAGALARAGESRQNALARELGRIQELVDAGRFLSLAGQDRTRALELEFDAVGAVLDRYGNLNEAVEKTDDIARELGLTFTSAFEDAIVEGGKLRDVLRGLEQDILRLVTRELVTKPLAGTITDALKGLTGGAGGSDFFTKLFGSLFGPRAMGGPVTAGQAYLVGERGPELFVPRQSGQVLDAERSRRSLGRAVTVNINVPASTSGASANQIGAAAARALSIADARFN